MFGVNKFHLVNALFTSDASFKHISSTTGCVINAVLQYSHKLNLVHFKPNNGAGNYYNISIHSFVS